MRAARAFCLTTYFAVAAVLSTACTESTGPDTGTIRVALTTHGEEPDPDGYELLIDHKRHFAVGVNGTIPISELPVGNNQVYLFGLASNCSTDEPNPQLVAVKQDQAVDITFTVRCVLNSGSLRVRVTSEGSPADEDGYVLTAQLAFGVSHNANVGLNDTFTFSKLARGSYLVMLQPSSVARNCSLAPLEHFVAINPGESSDVTLSVLCTPGSNLSITTSYTGEDYDLNGYSVRISGPRFDSTAAMPANGRVDIRDLAAGEAEVAVAGVAANCQLAGPRLHNLVLRPGASLDIALQVNCTRTDKRLAMVAAWGRFRAIFAFDIGDPEPFRLTNGLADDFNPAWSPDGMRIAFTSNRDGNNEIYVMNANGSNPIRLTAVLANDDRPSWSPDGKRIAFESSRGGDGDIYTMNADGSDVRPVTNNGLYDGQPHWSVTNRIVFVSGSENGPREIISANPDGSDLRPLTDHPGVESNPVWSPDGTRIAFARSTSCNSQSTCQSDLFVIDQAGRSAQKLNITQTGFSHFTEPSWSSDGKRIAFTAQVCTEYYSFYYSYCEPISIQLVALDGASNPAVLLSYVTTPRWR